MACCILPFCFSDAFLMHHSCQYLNAAFKVKHFSQVRIDKVHKSWSELLYTYD